MATDPVERPSFPASAEGFTPSPLAGTRDQAIQRLQVGLFGIGSMILLVGLANVVLTNARQNEAQVVPEAAPTVVTAQSQKPPSDPLAEAGIVPDLPAQSRSDAPAPPSPGTGDAAPPMP